MIARISGLSVVILLAASAASAQECLELFMRGTWSEAVVQTPLREARTGIRVTPHGDQQLAGARLAFVHIRRPARELDPSPEVTVVRLLTGSPRNTLFTFARPGEYWLTLHAAETYEWPLGSQDGGDRVCPEQLVTVSGPRLPPFHGVRGHAWIAYRPAARFETAGSVYINRLGFAGVFEVDPFSSKDDLNRWNVGGDVRWRGARGYIGAGVRYFPDDGPETYRVVPVFVAGEELPTFKGHPTWFMLDVRAERHWRPKFWHTLRLSFGVRIDITGDIP